MSELIRADLRDPTTGARKGVKNLTSSVLDEGLSTQRNALDVVQRDENGDIIGGTTNPQKVEVQSLPVMVVKESFDEGDLSTGTYTVTATGYGDVMGFGSGCG